MTSSAQLTRTEWQSLVVETGGNNWCGKDFGRPLSCKGFSLTTERFGNRDLPIPWWKR